MKSVLLAAVAALAISAPALAQAPVANAPQAQARVVLPAEVVPERYDIKVAPNMDALTFNGEVQIAIEVKKPTDRIVLNAADLTFRRVALSGRSEAPKVELDETNQRAAFIFAKPVTPGRYVLSIDYAGKIYQQASGLFALDYDDGGKQRRALFTQFEAADARRFVPSWDEPAHKAIFGLTVLAPASEVAVSNMPTATVTDVGNGLKATRFADSPKMSSYLLFMALGDFERVTRKVGDTEIGVVTRRGDTAKGGYALDAAAELLTYFNDYFGTPYPLPKMDMIAGPGRGQFFSAMENWGAIFYFENALLIDPKLSTEADRQRVYTVVAHEMAHQWFGNLVTMSWWDDLWLNEGFASWMENKATDALHPEWDVWMLGAPARDRAMALDAGAGTHPIIRQIPDILNASGAFDTITYQKGEGVIRMLEAQVGEADFREGVRSYMKRHIYGNTVTQDLWRALDDASPLDVVGIANDFTLQEGVPLINATAVKDGVRLTQGRFSTAEPPQGPLTWRVPVTVAKAGAQQPWRGVVSAGAPATAPLAAPVVVNAGHTGYYRTHYDAALFAPLAASFASLAPADQMALLLDSRALGEAGVAPMANFLELADRARPGMHELVLKTVAEQLDTIDGYYEGRPSQAAFRAFARSRLAPIAASLGWDAKPGEKDNVALLRAKVLTVLGKMGEPSVVAEARRRYAAYLANPGSLAGSQRTTVLDIVAANADAATWAQLHQLAKAATTSTEQARLYGLLGDSPDKALAEKALAIALTDEAPVTLRPQIVSDVSLTHPELAYAFAAARREVFDPLLETGSRAEFYAELADGSSDPAFAQKMLAFGRANYPGQTGEYDKAVAAIGVRAKVIADRLPEVDRWIASRSR